MIVVAPDKFKGSMSAAAVASVLAEALRAFDPDGAVVELPIADGGEGTVDVVLQAGMAPVTATVTGPLGLPVEVVYARGDGALAPGVDIAVIEMAGAAGLGRLGEAPGPATAAAASTAGVGQLIADAVDGGARLIVLGLGGSASTDGGIGLAVALGAVVETTDGLPLSPGGAGLADVSGIDLAPLQERLRGVEIVLAGDVDNPLTGPAGAAAVYGPQKGADAELVSTLDKNLAHWSDLIHRATGVDVADQPGIGAAGGAGVPLVAAGCARIESGLGYLLELTGLADRIAGADTVIVGEGALDHQSLRGKGPVGLARMAKAEGAGVIAVAGINRLDPEELGRAAIDRVYAMTDVEPDPHRCMQDPEPILRDLAARLAADLLGWEERDE